ncbi:MAG: P-loop containing nucleoside triphosphate hydrolase protein, partial [Olpidium bornovanus]
MGKGKTEKSRRAGGASGAPAAPANTRLKGENFYSENRTKPTPLSPDYVWPSVGWPAQNPTPLARNLHAPLCRDTPVVVCELQSEEKKKVRQVNMLKGGKPIRDAKGKIIKAAEFQSTEAKPGRALDEFRAALSTKVHDPYQVVMRQNKLPMDLLVDRTKASRVHMLDTESFGSTYGPKAQRKRPKLLAGSLEELAADADDKLGWFPQLPQCRMAVSLEKGQSKRIWGELYKVIDSSDVILHVLDARAPLGTRCRNVETYLKSEAKHKHLVFVLNKCDLVPTWVTVGPSLKKWIMQLNWCRYTLQARWVQVLSEDHPTIAFHASIKNSFGKGSLIQLLRQFSKLHSDKKQISVGCVGYPNTGKSSIINTLRSKKVCNVAPIPGETKVWQYITLMKRIYLIDCPGVVHSSPEDTETDIVLKGVLRVENIKQPEDHIADVIKRVKKEYLLRTYDLEDFESPEDFMDLLAK